MRSSGVIPRALGCQSRGRWFDSICRSFKDNFIHNPTLPVAVTRHGVISIPELDLTLNYNSGIGIDFQKAVGIDFFGLFFY